MCVNPRTSELAIGEKGRTAAEMDAARYADTNGYRAIDPFDQSDSPLNRQMSPLSGGAFFGLIVLLWCFTDHTTLFVRYSLAGWYSLCCTG